MESYFQYIACGPEKQITREEAVAVVRARCGLVVRLYPSATPIAVTVRSHAGLVGYPVVQINGWGWQEPVIAERYGKALVEAAAIAAEAQNPATVVFNGPWPDEARCQVPLVHKDKSKARCVLHKDHQSNDSDHIDEHGCHAPVLVHQSTIAEAQRISEAHKHE